MYVAITRARKRLYLSFSQTRMLHGQTRYNVKSRFFDELPEETLKWLTPRQQGYGSGYARDYQAAWARAPAAAPAPAAGAKLLPSQAMLNPKHALRFQREARAAARLHHPNIVPVFGIGEADGISFYAMQFIQGLALDQIATELKRLHCENWSSGRRCFAVCCQSGHSSSRH